MCDDGGKPKWSRPADAEPRIWLKDSGIVIRDVTPDLDKYVIDHMVKKCDLYYSSSLFLLYFNTL